MIRKTYHMEFTTDLGNGQKVRSFRVHTQCGFRVIHLPIPRLVNRHLQELEAQYPGKVVFLESIKEVT